MTCKYKVKIKDIQYNYKVQMTDIQSKYKFKVFCTGYDDSEIKEKIDAMYQAWPKVSGEGETITLNDTANTTMAIDLKGNTSQETTTGKNLMDSEWVDRTLNGVTITNNGDGTYTLNGTSTSSTAFSLQSITGGSVAHTLIGKIANNVGKYITISTGYSHNQGCYLQLNLSKQGGGSGQYGFISGVHTYSNKLISSNESDVVYINFFIGIDANASFNNLKIYPMITIQDSEITTAPTPSDFEPYTNGASPNPDYPQEIVNISGDNSIEVCGKNLLDTSSMVLGDLQNETGEEIPNKNKTHYRSGFIKVLPNTQYTFTTNYTYPSNSVTKLMEYGEDKSFIRRNSASSTNKVITFTTNSNTNYLRIAMYSNTAFTDFYSLKNMVVKGSETTYEPYQSQSYTVNLGSLELCKIDTYKDRIYPLNGKWYLEKKIGKVVLDGSENWQYFSSLPNMIQLNNYFNNISSEYTGAVKGLIFSNYFTEKSSGDVRTIEGICLFIQDNSNYLRLNNSNVATLEDFKSWLSNNNTTVYYVLATPTTTEITDSTLISQLEEIKEAESYSGQTNISQTNDNKPFILTAKALKDLSNL